jgi:hypothetical protein
MIVCDDIVVDRIEFEVVKLVTCRLDLGIEAAKSWSPLHRWYRFLRAIRYTGYTICTLVYVYSK